MKKVVPVTLSPPGTVPWQQQGATSPTPPSPSSLSSGSVSPSRHDSSWTHPSDLSLSCSSISSEKRGSHFWQSAPVSEWSKEQVSCSLPDFTILAQEIDLDAYKNFELTGLPLVISFRIGATHNKVPRITSKWHSAYAINFCRL